MGAESAEAADGTQRQASPIRLSAHHGPASAGGMACGQEAHPESEEIARPPSSSDQEEGDPARSLDGVAGEGGVQGTRLDLGFYLRRNHQRRSPPRTGSRRSTSNPAARGKPAMWRASTDDSGTNASTGNSSGRSPKPAWSSRTTAGNTTPSGRIANWAISARNASRLGRAHHLRLRSAYGLPTPEMDNPTTTH